MPTLIVNGLPRGYDYTVITGVCRNSAPRKLSVSSALPDPATDDLVLPLTNLPVSSRTVVWFTVTNVQGFELGGVRGSSGACSSPRCPASWCSGRAGPCAPSEGSPRAKLSDL